MSYYRNQIQRPRKRKSGRRKDSFRPLLEALEERTLLATGLQFNFNAAAGTPQTVIDGFAEAGDMWSSFLVDDVVVNVDISFPSLGAGVLGSTLSTPQNATYSEFRTSLTNDQSSNEDQIATANLPTGSSIDIYINLTSDNPNGSGSVVPYLDNDGGANNTTIDLTTANAKALGLRAANDPATDADIQFNSGITWDFTRSDGISANAIDFVATAAHEIGHALGFSSGVDLLDLNSPPPGINVFPANQFTFVSPLDMFRQSTDSVNAGADIDWTADIRTKFFSIDGGVTNLGPTFATGTRHGDGFQASHWKDDLGLGLMDPTGAPGEFVSISSNDVLAMDVIGWDLNAVPVVSANSSSVTINEGSQGTLSGSYSDANSGDDVVISASIGTVTKTGGSSGTWTWKFTPPDGDAAPTTVTITADDQNGGVAMTTFQFDVKNVAPTIALSGANSVIRFQNYALTLGAVTDPGVDTVSQFTINWGDGDSDTFNRAPNFNETANHVYDTTLGAFTITVDLVDEDGTHIAAGSKTITVLQENQPPTVNANSATLTVDEGSLAINTGTFNDPNAADNVLLTASIGSIVKSGSSSGTWFWSYRPNDGDAGPTTVTIFANDRRGGFGMTTFELNVDNVVPTIPLTGANTTFTKDTYSLTLGPVNEPGDDRITKFVINWGDGDSDTFNRAPNNNETAGHVYTAAGSRTITVDLVDEDGTHLAAGSKQIDVQAGSPLEIDLRDTLSNDGDGDGLADPGDTIAYTAEITNVENEDADSVTFESALDPNITLVPGSTKVTPIAFDDGFDVAANATLNDASQNLLTNDIDPDASGNLAVVNPAGISRIGGDTTGALTVFADGSFSYTASAQAGTETFEYFIEDGDGLQSVKSGIIKFTVAPTVPLLSQPVSTSIPWLYEAQLQNIVSAAKDRLAGAGISAADLEKLNQLVFTVAQLDAEVITQYASSTVLIDGDGAGNGWFLDVTPLLDEEFTMQGNSLLVARQGGAAADRLDLLTLVTRKMRQYLNPEIAEYGNPGPEMLLPGIRDIETDNTASSQLSQLRRLHGFHVSGSYDLNKRGGGEIWFRDRFEREHFLTPDGIIRLWNGVNLASSPIVAQVDSHVCNDPALLFFAPVQLSSQAQQELTRLQSSRGFYNNGSDWQDWGGRQEKWFRDRTGNYYFITPDGNVFSWGGRRNLSFSNKLAKLSSLVYDDLTLLFDADVQLSAQERQELGALRRSYGFYNNGKDWRNWGRWQEKWFRDRTGNYYFITPDGSVFRHGGSRNLATSTRLTTLNPDVYDDLTLLFEARVDLTAEELHEVVSLRQSHGFYSNGPDWKNWGGWQEKWFADRNDAAHFIIPNGNVYKWGGSGKLSNSTLIAQVGPLVYEDLDLLFESLAPIYTASALADNSSDTPIPANTLSAHELDGIVAAAIERWLDSGLSDSQRVLLQNTVFEVADLPNWYLASTSAGKVQIDRDAAGRGWFVDATPLLDEEYDIVHAGTRLSSSLATVRIDALTTVMHEMGHLLGLEDISQPAERDNLMYRYLGTGERRLPSTNQAENALPGDSISGGMLSLVQIGTLPSQKAVRVLFEANVNDTNPLPAGAEEAVVQGLAKSVKSGSNTAFPDRLSNDPDTLTPNDPTRTPIDAAPDLRLRLTATPPESVLVGGIATYSFEFDNVGTQDDAGVELLVEMSQSVELTSSAKSDGWRQVGGRKYALRVQNLPVGTSKTAKVSFRLAQSIQGDSMVDLTGTIRGNGNQGPDLSRSDNVVRHSFETIDFDDRRWR